MVQRRVAKSVVDWAASFTATPNERERVRAISRMQARCIRRGKRVARSAAACNSPSAVIEMEWKSVVTEHLGDHGVEEHGVEEHGMVQKRVAARVLVCREQRGHLRAYFKSFVVMTVHVADQEVEHGHVHQVEQPSALVVRRRALDHLITVRLISFPNSLSSFVVRPDARTNV